MYIFRHFLPTSPHRICHCGKWLKNNTTRSTTWKRRTKNCKNQIGNCANLREILAWTCWPTGRRPISIDRWSSWRLSSESKWNANSDIDLHTQTDPRNMNSRTRMELTTRIWLCLSRNRIDLKKREKNPTNTDTTGIDVGCSLTLGLNWCMDSYLNGGKITLLLTRASKLKIASCAIIKIASLPHTRSHCSLAFAISSAFYTFTHFFPERSRTSILLLLIFERYDFMQFWYHIIFTYFTGRILSLVFILR